MDKEDTQINEGKLVKNEASGKWECKYWRPAMTVDAVVFGLSGYAANSPKRLYVLLIERGEEPFKGKWALPGGFVQEGDKTLEHAVRRELKEEANGEINFLEEIGVFSDQDRDPRDRIITVAYMALVNKGAFSPNGGSDANDARWFPVHDIDLEETLESEEVKEENSSKIQLAFDHKQILREALKKLKRDIRLRPVGLHLLGEKFTMPMLYNMYLALLYPEYQAEIENPDRIVTPSQIMDRYIDRGNFSKKMHSLGYIDGIDDEEKPDEQSNNGEKVGYRHAKWYKWYRFNEEKYREKEEEGIHMIFNQKKPESNSSAGTSQDKK